MTQTTPVPVLPAADAASAGPAAGNQKAIVNRLRRAQGQLTAIIAALENGGKCRDVVIQLAAVSSALDKAGFQIISRAMQNCLLDQQDPADTMTVAELEKLFMTLT